MTLFIDTNIFLRIVVKDDSAKEADCRRLVEKIQLGKHKAVISTLVLAEVAWTLLSFYKLSKQQVAEVINGILAVRNLKIVDKTNHFLAMEFYQAYSIKFIDSLIAAESMVASKKGVLVSYDRDFDKLPVKRMEPSEL